MGEGPQIGVFERLVAARRVLPTPTERRRIRETAGVSLSDVAQPLGVSKATVHAWELGRTRPSREHVEGYLRILSVMSNPRTDSFEIRRVFRGSNNNQLR